MNKFCKYFICLAAVAAMTACSDDNIIDDGGNKVSVENQTLYVSMNIIGDSPTASRAAADNGFPGDGDFEDGTPAEENLINNAYFVFYDEDGAIVGDIVPVELDDSHLITTTTPAGTVERSYKYVVSVSVKKGAKMPTQVICYINPISPSTLQNTLSVIQTISRTSAWSTVSGSNTKYFAMSNSVYYPRTAGATTGLAPEDGLPQVAVPIPTGYLYKTEADAEAALGSDNTLNIYVERYATKLKFTAEKAPDPYKTGTRVYARNAADDGYQTAAGTTETKLVTLSFVPQYWAVNAESNRTYVIKSFRQENEQGEILADNYEFGALNSRINPATYNDANLEWLYGNGATILGDNERWDWNAPDYHRSYWGMSPAYFTSEYPEVSSDLRDITVNQKYISYKELSTPGNGIGFEADNATPQYFRETTVSYRALNSNNPNAAVASVIYVGQYNVNLAGTNLPEGTPFYTYLSGNVPDASVTEDRPFIYFNTSLNENGTVKSNVAGGESMLLRFLAQATILYRESTDEEEAAGGGKFTRLSIARDSDIDLMLNALRVDTISDAVKIAYDGDHTTKLKLQNNSRSLQFTNAQAAAGIYIVTGGGYMKIVADDATDFDEKTQIRLTDANLTLMRQVGLSYYYTTGHAYFSIPVKHFGWYRPGNKQKDAEKINWNIVRVGDFGMVRNHSYQVNVKKITGLASGIGDDDNPIVPPANTQDYFMAYSVNILKWAVVPVQNVNL